MKEKIKNFLLEEFPGDIYEKGKELYLHHLLIKIENTFLYDAIIYCNEAKIEIMGFETNKNTIRHMIQEQLLFLKVFKEIHKLDSHSFIVFLRENNGRSGELFFQNQFHTFYIEFSPTIQGTYHFSIAILFSDRSIEKVHLKGSLEEIEHAFIPQFKEKLKMYKLKSVFLDKEKDRKKWFVHSLGFESDFDVVLENVDFEYVQEEFKKHFQTISPGNLPQLTMKRKWGKDDVHLENLTIEQKRNQYIIRKHDNVKEAK